MVTNEDVDQNASTKLVAIRGEELSGFGHNFMRERALTNRVTDVVQFLRNLAISGQYGYEDRYWALIMQAIPTSEGASFWSIRGNPHRIRVYNHLLMQCRAYQDFIDLTQAYVHFLVYCLPPAVAFFGVDDLRKRGLPEALPGLLTIANHCNAEQEKIRRQALSAAFAYESA